jgi:hypothetical protein
MWVDDSLVLQINRVVWLSPENPVWRQSVLLCHAIGLGVDEAAFYN